MQLSRKPEEIFMNHKTINDVIEEAKKNIKGVTPPSNFCRLELQVIPPPNIIYNEDCMETMRRLPDKCVSLIIADPPYYKIKGEFDWKWKTFGEYLSWMEGLAKEFKRILADNGSLFVYSHWRRVAYIQVIFDKYFSLVNNICWQKTEKLMVEMFDLRSLPARFFERILFYSKESDAIKNVREYLRDEITKAKGGIKFGDINAGIKSATNGGGVASAILSYHKEEPQFITEDIYNRLREWLGNDYLKIDYQALCRPFNNVLGLSDHWFFASDFEAKNIEHETVKPLKMSKAMVAMCSKEKNLVYIPFVGSGTECVAVNELNRIYLGSEIKKEYCKIAEARIRGNRRKNYDIFYDAEAV